jgi:hypothetical protein
MIGRQWTALYLEHSQVVARSLDDTTPFSGNASSAPPYTYRVDLSCWVLREPGSSQHVALQIASASNWNVLLLWNAM